MKRNHLFLALAGSTILIVAGSMVFLPRISHAGEETVTQTAETSAPSPKTANSQSFTGTLQAGTDYEVLEFSISGLSPLIVEQVYKKNGDTVSTNDAILKITDDSYQQALSTLKRNVRTETSNYQTAKITYEAELLALKSTYSQNCSTSDLARENYNTTVAVLNLQVSQAKSAYQDAQNICTTYPAKLQTCTQKKEKLQAQKKKAAALLKKQETQYNNQKKDCADKEQEMNAASTQLDKTKTIKEYLTNYIKKEQTSDLALNSLLEQLAMEYEQKQTTFEAAKHTYEAAKKALEQTEKKVTNTTNIVSNKTKKLQLLTRQITQYKTDLTDAQSQLEALQTAYQQALSNRKKESLQAKADYEKEALTTESATSSYQEEKQALKDTLLEAKNAYQQARNQLHFFKKCLKDGVWYAQKDGTISFLSYEKGNYLSDQTPIVGYQDTTTLSAELTVDQTAVSNFQVGDSITVYGTNTRNGVQGTISKISSNTDTNTKTKVTYSVTLSVSDKNSDLSVGDTVSVRTGEATAPYNKTTDSAKRRLSE